MISAGTPLGTSSMHVLRIPSDPELVMALGKLANPP
jgi:hypothetical protein